MKKLVTHGVDLRIDTVGFDVEGTARTQLECLAEAGGGEYYDAADADELDTRLSKISQRAVRDFAFTGTPVTGIELAENEQPPADLPTLSPGIHTDELTAGEDTWRAYRVKRTQQGSTLHVSLTNQPDSYDDPESGDYDSEELSMKILAPDGTVCTSPTEHGGSSQGTRPIMTVTARLVGEYPADESGDQACLATGTFTVLTQRQGAQRTTATELQVIEEPAVTNLEELPEAVDDYPDEVELPKGEEQPVTGGLSFSDAAEITSGTWRDTFVPGETLVYRVKVENGQTVRFTNHGPTGGFRFPEDTGSDRLQVDGRAYAPDRQHVGDSIWSTGSFGPSVDSPKSVTAAPVRFRNRFAPTYVRSNLAASSMGGWHYYAVNVGTEDVGEQLAGQPIKIAFTVQVEGQPSSDVEYDAAGDDWNPTPADEDQSGGAASEDASAAAADDGRPAWLRWLGGGLLATALLVAGAWFMLRRLVAH